MENTGQLLVRGGRVVGGRSGAVVYEGATLYRVEKDSGAVRYDYFNSMGDLLTGYAKRDGQTIRFPEKPGEAGDLVWSLGAEAYEVGTAAAASPKRKFVKVGPAPEGGF